MSWKRVISLKNCGKFALFCFIACGAIFMRVYLSSLARREKHKFNLAVKFNNEI